MSRRRLPAGGSAAEAATARLSGAFFVPPSFSAPVIGLALHSVRVPAALAHSPVWPRLGAVVVQCLGYLGQGTTPLVLLALGVSLRPGAALAQPRALALACTIKLLFVPAAAWAVCRALTVGGEVRAETVLASAMPAAVVASVLAGRNDMEGDFAVGVVFAATVLSRSHHPPAADFSALEVLDK